MLFSKLEFQVESSSTGEIYYVEISRTDDKLTCTCTCPAASNGTHCKHRLSILQGDKSNINDGDTDKIEYIAQMLAGTEVERALNLMLELEAQKAEVDKQLKTSKKQLARALAS